MLSLKFHPALSEVRATFFGLFMGLFVYGVRSGPSGL